MKYLLLALLFISTSAYAESFKIATVDMSRLINDTNASKSKKSELDKISQSKKKTLEAKRAKLQKLEEKLKAKDVSSESSEADNFRVKARELAREIKDAEDEVKQKYLRSTKELYENAQKVVDTYAANNDISIVLDKNQSARGPILYGQSSLDITEEVLTKLNNG